MVDAWGGFSGRARLTWFSMKTLSTHPHTDIVKNSLLPAAKEWFGDEKEGWELQQDKATCHTGKVHEDLVGEA